MPDLIAPPHVRPMPSIKSVTSLILWGMKLFEGLPREVEPPHAHKRKAGPGRPVDPAGRRLNLALADLAEGRSGTMESLSVVTGLTPQAVALRIARARFDDTPPEPLGLDATSRRFLTRTYAKSTDPEVIAFLAKLGHR